MTDWFPDWCFIGGRVGKTLSLPGMIVLDLCGVAGSSCRALMFPSCYCALHAAAQLVEHLLSAPHPIIGHSVCVCGCHRFDFNWVPQRLRAAMKPGCCNCRMSLWMYSAETLSHYIILWTDFSPLGGDLSLACHGHRIQWAAGSGGCGGGGGDSGRFAGL